MSHLVDDSEAVGGNEANNINEDGTVIDNSEASGRDYKVDPEFLREQNILALELLILSLVFIIFLCFLGVLKKHFLARGWCLWCLSEGAKLKHIASLSSLGTTQSDSNTFLNRVYSTDDMLAAWGSDAYSAAARRSIVAYNNAVRRSIVEYNAAVRRSIVPYNDWDGEENDDATNTNDSDNCDSSKTIITNNKGMMGRRVSFSMDFDEDGDIDVQTKKDIDQNKSNELEIISEHAQDVTI